MSEINFTIRPYLDMVIEQDKIFLQRLGKRISELRLRYKLTKVQLAFEINTSESNIRRIEKGQINVGIITLNKIAEVFNISLSELVRFD
ncbi:helix-turn-helix transcriptional regulator [Crocinitomicaceae bacterium CZZ-1]|uniref:Helix-turn-helix transcriptional regulator n=1 Tax=Taishania pollutisoli TaxID=2766479 RepID=A0A8J6PDY2_9FLAO|nr:helix-turn-helix transcriptional regulator [Taishania pollutisoli]MBC9811870.1 helix-turn-helix transcriptional regulator [Taishania pollutisoli]MBX2948187.1 helix-turn-helix transcriptional regulator [Crocinitomicaceae bacterium]NGF75293.1 helix-turn-helix transcriptional regulator [Fluviicola sp. SGL-29]